MSAVLRFINIMEKVLILINIICFIPTSVFVFQPNHHVYTTSEILTYNRAYAQTKTPFILTFNTNNCTYRESLLNNTYCFERANINSYSVVPEGATCTGYSYVFNESRYCSGANGTINNEFTMGIDGSYTFGHNDNLFPIWSISPPFNSPKIEYFHYSPQYLPELCESLSDELTSTPQSKLSYQIYQPYEDSSRLLWYSLLPTLVALLIFIILNELSNKYDFRKEILVSSFCISVGLITLIIKGITFYSLVDSFMTNMGEYATCFVATEESVLTNMANNDLGVSFGFVFFMGIVALFLFLGMAGQLISKILEWKYYKTKGDFSQSVELSDLKTSLRSKRHITPQSSSFANEVHVEENY